MTTGKLEIELSAYVDEHIAELNRVMNVAREIALKEIQFIREGFDYRHLTVTDLDKFEMNDVLYLFRIVKYGNGVAAIDICAEVERLKKKRSKLKLPHVNMQNQTGNKDILYVGKSSGSFRTRLKQHLTSASASTYALHLQEWRDNKVLGNIELELCYAPVTLKHHKIKNATEEKDILEFLESSLHRQFKPLLGRSGH
jgi:hypothetical protein